MSFLRHARSIGPMWVLASCQVEPECRLPLVGTGNQHKGATEIAPLLIVRDESHRLSLGELVSTRARLRFAGCIQFAIKEYGRSRIFQRTANSVLTVCVSRGDKRNPVSVRLLRPYLIEWNDSASAGATAALGFFSHYRHIYPVTRNVLHDISERLGAANPITPRLSDIVRVIKDHPACCGIGLLTTGWAFDCSSGSPNDSAVPVTS